MWRALTERWNREKQEAIEASRLFDVLEKAGRLLIVKRQKPVMQRVGGTLLFTLFWCFVIWQSFSSPINRSSWLPWGILWFSVMPTCWLVFEAREAWSVWKTGDVWVFDRTANTLERNGCILIALNELQSVKATESLDSESVPVYDLCLEPIKGKEIKIGYYGFANHWEHLLDAAKQISDYAGLELIQERM